MKKKFNFFIKVFFSLGLTFLITFYFIRSKKEDSSYSNYFSKIIRNFSSSFQEATVFQAVQNWFSPTLKENDREKFIQYKLTILSKNIDRYFKGLLHNTQENLLDEKLKRSIKQIGTINLNASKSVLRKYIKENPDVQEVSLYNLKGKKLMGLRYQNIPDYLITENLLLELKNKNNLLLKHRKTSYLILLSLVKEVNKPFMVISQTIHPAFFDRILTHLEMKEELFYLKDSHHYVLLDNYHSYQKEKEKKSNVPYDLYQALIDSDERNLEIMLDDVEYSVGVIIEKNNVWGNLLAMTLLLFVFSIGFILIDWSLGIAYRFYFLVKKVPLKKEQVEQSVSDDSLSKEKEPAFHFNSSVRSSESPFFKKKYPDNSYLKKFYSLSKADPKKG